MLYLPVAKLKALILLEAKPNNPLDQPTNRPTNQPTDQSTNRPTVRPTDQPTDRPTDRPTDLDDRHHLDHLPARYVWHVASYLLYARIVYYRRAEICNVNGVRIAMQDEELVLAVW